VIATGVDARHPHFAAFRNTQLLAPLRHLDYSTFDTAMRDAEAFSQRDEDDFILQDRFKVDDPVDAHGTGTAVAGIIAGHSTDLHGDVLQGFTAEAKILSVNLFEVSGNASEFNLLAALKPSSCSISARRALWCMVSCCRSRSNAMSRTSPAATARSGWKSIGLSTAGSRPRRGRRGRPPVDSTGAHRQTTARQGPAAPHRGGSAP
jgi:hypothetical protein